MSRDQRWRFRRSYWYVNWEIWHNFTLYLSLANMLTSRAITFNQGGACGSLWHQLGSSGCHVPWRFLGSLAATLHFRWHLEDQKGYHIDTRIWRKRISALFFSRLVWPSWNSCASDQLRISTCAGVHHDSKAHKLERSNANLCIRLCIQKLFGCKTNSSVYSEQAWLPHWKVQIGKCVFSQDPTSARIESTSLRRAVELHWRSATVLMVQEYPEDHRFWPVPSPQLRSTPSLNRTQYIRCTLW
jgi:hypothetical protein